MATGLGLFQGQYQKLIMTPELRQAIKILELPTMELLPFLQEEILENPLLEIEEELELPKPPEEAFEPEWLDYFDDRSDIGYIEGRRVNKDHDGPTAVEPRSVESRYERLLGQLLSESGIGQDLSDLVKVLIWNLDDRGYLDIGIKELSGSLGVSEERLSKALDILQSFDPPGVGARSLSECLLLQCRAKGWDDPKLTALIEFYLEDLADGRFTRISEVLGCSQGELKELVNRLKKLTPTPGLSPTVTVADGIRYVIADVVVRKVGRQFTVSSNDGSCPKLIINSLYRQLLKNRSGDPQTADYIKKKLSDAVRFIKNIDQRRSTILRVAAAIVEYQEDFMRGGQRFLKPLTLKDVADRVGVHESTVSRAVNGKYIDTPKGVYEMRYFFTSGVRTNMGDGTSSISVKKRIAELIEAEDSSSPLTDDGLASALKDEGIRISRRTVAKYRDELSIPPSTKRKIL